LLLVACAPDALDGTVPHASADGRLDVPAEYATIQDAVDAARPGDLVLIAPGTYEESVTVRTEDLTIRGLDRNVVVLDGQFNLANGITVVGADGVAIENITVMNYTANGFFWSGVKGYRGSYLTSYRTGFYGIYAFDSIDGQIDHSYTAGSPDGGVYIGQCFPCDVVVDSVVSEYNGLGYSGTDAGGNLLIVNSTFRFNRVGIALNTHTYELCYPQREATIVGNLVDSNGRPDTPAIDIALREMSNGILVAGGVRNLIARNRVFDHDKTGIALIPYVDFEPRDTEPPEAEWGRSCADQKTDPPADPAAVPKTVVFHAQQNRVEGNVVEDSGVADLAVGAIGEDPSTLGNCFAGNTFTTSRPRDLEVLAPCDATGGGNWNLDALFVASWLREDHPRSADYRTASPPLRPQENMADAATAPARPATDVPEFVDVEAIGVPDKPA